jgi:hypothetical protein
MMTFRAAIAAGIALAVVTVGGLAAGPAAAQQGDYGWGPQGACPNWSAGAGRGPMYGRGMDPMYYGQGMGPMYGQGMGPMYGQGMGPMYGQGMGPMYGQGMGPGMGQGYMAPPGAMMRPGPHMRFASIDENANGVVEPDEAARRSEERFAILDANGDDMLTAEEHASVHFGAGAGCACGGPYAERMQARKAQRFQDMDADGDRTVTQAEFMSAHQKRFETADANGDGVVSVWEFRSRPRS